MFELPALGALVTLCMYAHSISYWSDHFPYCIPFWLLRSIKKSDHIQTTPYMYARSIS